MSTKGGGGVCILLSNNIHYKQIQIPALKNSNLIAVDIFDSQTLNKHRLINIYRPTINESLEHFCLLIDVLTDLCTIDFHLK